jgi:hypothetical protein
MVKNCESACREEGCKVLTAEIGALHSENDRLKEADPPPCGSGRHAVRMRRQRDCGH